VSEHKANILLVDDHPENLVALGAVLDELGQNHVLAHSGKEALKCVLNQEFALILLDVKMPGMSGFETATLIRSREKSKHIPIIFMTAYSHEETQIFQGYSLGAVDFLFKPLQPEVIKSKVSVFVELYHKTREVQEQSARLLEAQRSAHDRELARARQEWEAQRLRKERDQEKQNSARLQESYDRLAALEQLRDDLTHMIVHDLRTPLTSLITGMQTLATLGELNESQKEFLDIAVTGGYTLLGMINDMLDIGKMEDGSLQLADDRLQVSDLIDICLRQVAWLAQEKGISASASIAEGLSDIYGDEEKLRRAIVNLLGNAYKFTPAGGSVKVIAQIVDLGGALQFGVQDTGVGIPQHAFERIFEKFGQVESRKAGNQMSTGLGLTFCKMVIEAHGGRIWVESEVGKGSTFWFTIPLRCVAQDTMNAA